MSTPEWDEAFKQGNPEVIAGRLLAAIQQAYEESKATGVARDIGELAGEFDPAVVMPLMTRAVEILADQGVRVHPGPAESPE